MLLQESHGQGVAQAIKVHGQGTVLWSLLDEAAMLRTLKVPTVYIPNTKVKLLSVNSLLDVYPEETVTLHPQGATMTGVTLTEEESTSQELQAISCPPHTPTSMEETTRCPAAWPTLFQTFITPISLNTAQKELLRWCTTDWVTWASRNS